MLSAAPSPKSCCHCGKEFLPQYTTTQQACSLRCAASFAKKARVSKEKQERAKVKTRKEAIKTIPQLIKEAQVAFNAFIRQRDCNCDCICCGRPLGDGEVGGSYDCGHYRSTGSASHLRFDERNAHAQRKQCNRWGAGRAVDYRIGLIARIGLAAVESLEADNGTHKWDRDELVALRETYKQKLKALKEQA